MPKAKRNTNDVEHPSDYFSDIDEWPNDWMAVEEDLQIGRGLLALFIPYVKHLIDEGLAKKDDQKQRISFEDAGRRDYQETKPS
jgi:hypothetical protein